MSEKRISYIVPCYKVEKYLPRCLDSLLSQTLDNIEVICINDGSPDGCLEILRKYEREHPDTIVVIDKENEGVWRGRLDAIKVAKGDYIGFVDSDDYVESDFAEKLYRSAVDNDADIAVCGFTREDHLTGKALNVEMTQHRQPFSAKKDPQRLLELNGAPWNKIFRANLLKDIYDFENPPRIFDDMILHLLTYPKVDVVAFTPHSLVNYIIRDDSIMTTIDQSKISSAYDAMLEVKEVYSKSASRSLQEFLDAAAFLHLGLSLMFRVSYDSEADIKTELRDNKTYLNKHFPTWNTNAIISKENAKKYRGALQKTYYGRMIYRSPLMATALDAYRLLIKSGIDIKW